jgi:hypothetical protein
VTEIHLPALEANPPAVERVVVLEFGIPPSIIAATGPSDPIVGSVSEKHSRRVIDSLVRLLNRKRFGSSVL